MTTPLSSSLPPEVERYFAKQKEEQQKLLKTAHAKKNLRETTHMLSNAMEKMLVRGTELEMSEEDANALV